MQATQHYIKHLLRHGFVVLPRDDAEKFLELLRERGAIHLFHVTRLSRYVVVELNKAPCLRECDPKCRDLASGKKLIECETSCIDQCAMERMNVFVSKVLGK